MWGDPKLPVHMYTDAQGSPAQIGGVLLDEEEQVWRTFGAVVPKSQQQFFLPRRTNIGGYELLAAQVVFSTWAQQLAGRTVMLWIDKRGAERQVIRGAAREGRDHNELVAFLWQRAYHLGVHLRVNRVASKSNIADGPSRGRWREVNALGLEITRDDVLWPPETEGVRAAGRLAHILWGPEAAGGG